MNLYFEESLTLTELFLETVCFVTVIDIFIHFGLISLGTILGDWTKNCFMSSLDPAQFFIWFLWKKQSFKVCCSFPSVTKTTTCPSRFLPVLPILCIILMGDLLDMSKHTISSTSPTSNPSSPIEVESNVLQSPSLNVFITLKKFNWLIGKFKFEWHVKNCYR